MIGGYALGGISRLLCLLVMAILILNGCESREDRINRSTSRYPVSAQPKEDSRNNRHHGDRRLEREGEISGTGGTFQHLLEVEGNRLVFRNNRKITLLGVADNVTTESYLRKAFSEGRFQEPITFYFDSRYIPRRPARATQIDGYAVDAQGLSINGLVLREKVSRYVLEGVTDSSYAFQQYAATNYAAEPAFDVDLMKKTTFQVRVFNDGGRKLGTGSGFFIAADGIGISNFHVFEPGSHYELVRCSDGHIFRVRNIIKINRPDDWVVFSVRPDSAFRYLTLAETDPSQGEQVYVFGNPRELTCSLTSGIVSALRENGGRIQIDAAISPGNSGSPVVNKHNAVIGIATYKRRDCESCNFAVNARSFAQFFQQ